MVVCTVESTSWNAPAAMVCSARKWLDVIANAVRILRKKNKKSKVNIRLFYYVLWIIIYVIFLLFIDY